MSHRASQARPGSSRSRRQRLAAGAVLASTTLLGTYLAAVRPQPTYASPNRSDASQQPDGRGLLRPATSAPSIPTCGDADDTVSNQVDLRAAILRSDDDSVICISSLITLTSDLPTIDDTTLTLVGDDSTTDGINGDDTHQLIRANFGIVPGGDDTVTISGLTLSNGYPSSFSGGYGGAVAVLEGGLVIVDSTVTSSRARSSGGGLYIRESNALLERTTISANEAGVNSPAGQGAGISVNTNSLVAATEVSIFDNVALSGGGAVSVAVSDAVFENSFIGRNGVRVSSNPYSVGGIAALASNVDLVFSTVYANTGGARATDFLRFYSDLRASGSVIGNSTDDSPSLYGRGPGNVTDLFSVSTGPGAGFTGSGSRNVAAGTLGLGAGALTGAGPGRPGLSPASTSVLVTGAPTSNLGTDVNVDQLGNPRPGSGTTWTIGSRQVPFTPTPPGPSPVYPPSAPREVTAVPGDGSAVVSWREPASSGSFPITDYRVTAGPGGASCLVKAPATSCEITGLTNGQPYTFTVEALNGAGWGSKSEPSEPVTPERGCSRATITLDQGTRVAAGRHDRIRTGGSTTCIPEGTRLTPHIRYSGQSSFQEGKATIVVQTDGTFRWTRRIKDNRGLTAYVAWEDVESNKVFWARVR